MTRLDTDAKDVMRRSLVSQASKGGAPQAAKKGSGGKGPADACWNFNPGRCTGARPRGRAHVCAHCGKPHPISRCFTASQEDKAWFANRPVTAAAGAAPKAKAPGKVKKGRS